MIIHAETILIFVTYYYSTQLPPKTDCREASTLIYTASKEKNTLRQKQHFENSQKYPGMLERASVSRNHNKYFPVWQPGMKAPTLQLNRERPKHRGAQ